MLTARKRAFIESYKSTRNATESAKLSGYSPHTARSIGSRLLTDVDVKTALGLFEQEQHEKYSKENFVDVAWKEFETAENSSPQKARYLEIAGKALGYFNDGGQAPKDIVIQIHNTLGAVVQVKPVDT